MAKQLTFNDDGLITESELKEEDAFLKEAIKSENVYNGESVVILNVKDVYGNPHQPRKFFDNTALYELAESIKQHGVIQPIVVCKTANKYMIIAGERRFRASKMAGLTTIPAIVKIYTEKQIKEVSLIENLQREDLNPIETAEAMKELMEEFNLTQEELAERLGKSRSSVANTLRLLSLAPEVSILVADGKLSAGHARALITIPKNKQRAFADKVIAEDLSVREVEKLVRNFLTPPEEKKKPKPTISKELRDMVDRMQRSFGTKVTAIGNDNKGRIYVDYYTRDDLDRICEILDKIENTKR
ncbi:MAG: ParB/RepB/Spo0J family partition protein [Clostridia bacterium]|nr:ParB/RepB/Spo0J family partition protein [Clostridia bacterium]